MFKSASTGPIEVSENRYGNGSADRSERATRLAFKAFMSMNRAVAIVGPDGKLLQPNLAFEKLFGDAELLDRINRDAGANNGKSDLQITLSDGRAFWVETIPMDGGWLVSAYDMNERLAKERTDTVTKLGNRLMFHERLAELIANPDRATEGVAILVVDLSRFKAINELLGRNIGSALLGAVADRIRSVLGGGDIAARLGGDKFGIIQAGQPQPQSAADLASRLVDLIGRSYLVEGHLIDIAASAGMVLFPADATDGEQLLKKADLALHRAKSEGHGAYRFFERAMDEKMQYRRNLEIDLRRALALGEFSLVYQPQFNLRLNMSHRIRSIASLAQPNPRRGVAARIYSGRGRYRNHYLDRRMGASDRLSGGGQLGRRAECFRQCVGDPVQECKSRRHDHVGAGGKRSRPAAFGARDHRKRDARCRRNGAHGARKPSRNRRVRGAR